MLERQHLLVGLCLEELDEVAEETEGWVSLLKLQPPHLDKRDDAELVASAGGDATPSPQRIK